MSEQVKHTPGPWRWRMSRDINVRKLVGSAEVPIVIRNGRWVSPTADANERLIAAAPELLDALQALLVCPDGYCCCSDCDPGKPDPEHTGECREARAAIAKATTPTVAP